MKYHSQQLEELCESVRFEHSALFWTGREDRKDGYYFVTINSILGEELGVISYFDKNEFFEDLKSVGVEFGIEIIQN